MTPPVVSDAAQRIYDRLRPYQADDAANGYLLLELCESIAKTLAKPTEVLRYDDTGSGWRRTLDPARTPDWMLPWLAQCVGSPSLDALTVEQQRLLISDAPGFRRGTLGAVKAAGIARLDDPSTDRIEVLERLEGYAYHIGVYAYTSMTGDEDAVLAALRAAVPAGLILDFAVYDGWVIGVLEMLTAGDTIGDFESDPDFATVLDVEEHIPA